MKKKIISIMLTVALIFAFVPTAMQRAQAAPPTGSIIQDPNFYAAVLEIIGKSDGHVITAADVSKITQLQLWQLNIHNLSGIEHFTALEILHCGSNQLTTLDVSHNSALKRLICTSNLLSELDVHRNTALEYLACGSNGLTKLDVTGLTNLNYLDVRGNYIPSINDLTGRNSKLVNGENVLFYWQNDPAYKEENTQFQINGFFGVSTYGVRTAIPEVHELNLKTSNESEVKKRAIELTNNNEIMYDEEIITLAKSITEGISDDYHKAKAIHKWIAENIVYNYYYFTTNKGPIYTDPLDVLKYKISICDGYARLNAELLCSLGIPAVYVTGVQVDQLKSVQNANHAWNEVYINGTWIYSNVTYDARYECRDSVGTITKFFEYDEDELEPHFWTGEKWFDIPLEKISLEYWLFEYKLIGTVLTSEAPLVLDSASTWARDGITSAIGKGFVPAEIQSSYTNVITRAEFCRMAIKWVEYATGKNIDTVLSERGLSRNPNAFTDTNDPAILAAYALSITSGTGNNQFSPNGQFDRQQAAGMIMNTCRAIGADVSNPPTSDFVDLDTAATWARDGINFVRANGIMQGTGNNSFSPSTPYTREQSIVTFDNINHSTLPGR